MKALPALVLVILVNCFCAEEDFAFRLKALEHDFATKLQKDDLRIRNLEETVKRQETVLYDQWKNINQLNGRLETQDNIIKRLLYGHSDVQEDKDSKSIGTPDEIRDPEWSTSVVKDALLELDETIKGTSFLRNQPTILNHFAEEVNENSTNRANSISTKDDIHDTQVTKANDQEPHNVGSKYSRAIVSPVHAVAFTAIKYQDQDGIGINQKIIFEHVILNEGGGYNVNHGIFTAPVTGYYLISTSILHSPQSNPLKAVIMHNGALIAIAYGSPGVSDQGTQTVVLKVTAGEQVWIGNRDSSNVYVVGSSYSSFSGFLLHQL
ncbi:uncharacterized protein LOC127846668 [Dreissena polymorpha]|uniref:C1q domain-containing protein n=1 Tax=Dreissena polymorpha TaxID=45954 RepID=A0A9D4S2T4_DREPO|nr:uncharacterized protein LOC127846668 [Dreissena polymorpha]KAH3888388.1 hypothetical protein DPMN_012421 [Dreissena polymorpha]